MGPWYVRVAHFTGAMADDVTVYVLFGLESNLNSQSFLRDDEQRYGSKVPSTQGLAQIWSSIDVEALMQFENNWDILKT